MPHCWKSRVTAQISCTITKEIIIVLNNYYEDLLLQLKSEVEEKRPQTQSGVISRPDPAPTAKPGLTPKPDQEPQLTRTDPKAGSNKDDYLGLGEEIDPNKLLRFVNSMFLPSFSRVLAF